MLKWVCVLIVITARGRATNYDQLSQDLTEIPRDMPVNTTRVRLPHHSITHITNENMSHLVNLQLLNRNINSLTNISKGAKDNLLITNEVMNIYGHARPGYLIVEARDRALLGGHL